MKNILVKSRDGLHTHFGIFIFAVVLLWIKTYAAYKVEFNLGISNILQEFLLFINPLSSAILFLGLALFSKGKRVFLWIISINLILSFILYANIVYYRFFSDFITLPTFTQTNNAGDLGGSIIALLRPYDILYFLDTIILIVLAVTKHTRFENSRMARQKIG